MEKSILEKRIHEKAVIRFKKDIADFVSYINNSPLRCFEIEVQGEKSKIPLTDYGTNWALITTDMSGNRKEWLKEHSNFYELKEEIIKKYEKEETDKILEKLENLDYLWRES